MTDDPRLSRLSEAIRSCCEIGPMAAHDLAEEFLRAIDAPRPDAPVTERRHSEMSPGGDSRPTHVRITGPMDAVSVTVGKVYAVSWWNGYGDPVITNDYGLEWTLCGDDGRPTATIPSWEPAEAPLRAAWELDESSALVEARTLWYADKTVNPGDSQEVCFIKGVLARSRREKGGA